METQELATVKRSVARDLLLTVRVSPEERAQLTAAAKRAECATVAEFIRRVAKTYAFIGGTK